jgi:hypothetical protein
MCGMCDPAAPKPIQSPIHFIWESCVLDRAMLRFKEYPDLTDELFRNPAHSCWPSKTWETFANAIVAALQRVVDMLNSKRMSEMLNENVHKTLFPTWL